MVCGWAGNTCAGWSPTTAGAFGLTLTVIVIGWFQLLESNTTAGAPSAPPVASNRGSAEETSVLPSVRIVTVTGAVGALVSWIVYVAVWLGPTIVEPVGWSTRTPPESPSMMLMWTVGLSTTPSE